MSSSSTTSKDTRGAQLLRACGVTVDEIAHECGVSSRTVGHWRAGSKLPSPASRTKLHEVYNIDPGDWARVPRAYVPPAWLLEASAHLINFPAALEAMIRSTIVASGDAEELQRYDEHREALWSRYDRALWDRAVAAEAACQAEEDSLLR